MERLPDGLIDGMAGLGERFSAASRWLMDNGRWVFGVEAAAEYVEAIREYSLTGIAGDIECPTLALAGEDDHFVPVELAAEFVDEVGERATLRVFETASGAGEHCQARTLSLVTGVIYDWLDDVIERSE